MVTIQDVAKKANVSISTVSRVINGKNNVSYEKKSKVLEAIRETGYIPPERGNDAPDAEDSQQNNAGSQKGIILVVSNVVHKELYSSLRENAEDYGYDALFLLTGTVSTGLSTLRQIKMLQQAGLLSGIALINPVYNHPEYYRDAALQNIPTVLIDSTYQGANLCYIGNNEYQSAYDLTEFLLQRYKKLFYIATFTSENPDGLVLSLGNDRKRGFADAMRAHGYKDDEFTILHEEHTFIGGREAAKKILMQEELPDAVICASDYIALGLINEFEKNGVHVPENVGVACISGENEFPDVVHPELTRVRQSFDDIGHAAVSVLDDLISKKISTKRTVLIDYQIIPGETTKN